MYNKLWVPDQDNLSSSHLAQFLRLVNLKHQLALENYEELQQWSVTHLDAFWEALIEYYDIRFETPYSIAVKKAIPFYNTQWFQGASLSYTAHIIRNYNTRQPAVIFQNESGKTTHISWNALLLRTAQLKQQWLDFGISKGDRVVGYLLNHPDTIAAFLATNALGAVWSCCSPDFGIQSAINRFEQLTPKLLIAHESYTYSGKNYELESKIQDLQKGLPSIQHTFCFSGTFEAWDLETTEHPPLDPVAVAFEHPIWVLFSSGTTGKPKAITHSTGGMVLEQYKALGLHQNLQPGERFFWNTTTGWMMWNYALGALLHGNVLCLYDGAPAYPDLGQQWRFAQTSKINHFGHGAPFFTQCMKTPPQALTKKSFPALKTIGSTGAPLSAAAFEFLQKQLPKAQIISLSGGTDVCSAFIGGNPTQPVYAGYLQCCMLGAAIAAWDHSGTAVEGATGELVITQPMPSMPIYFWGDTTFSIYHKSYFERFPEVWSHGDWIKIEKGIGIEVLGRSDATLNKNGIRIGTAEIYSALDDISILDDHLIVDFQTENQSILLLFVQTKQDLNPALVQRIQQYLRTNCSPRHVPDRILKVPEIPYTISGKKMEIPVKKFLMGIPLEDIATPGAMKNPWAFDAFNALKNSILPLS